MCRVAADCTKVEHAKCHCRLGLLTLFRGFLLGNSSIRFDDEAFGSLEEASGLTNRDRPRLISRDGIC